MHRRLKTISFYLIAGFVVTGATVTALAEFHEELREQWLHAADTFVTNAIRAWSSGYLDFIMRALSFLGSWKVLTPLVILSGIGLLRSHQSRSAALLWIGNGGALILGILAKLHFARVRPDVEWALTHEESYSFPSGHALSGMVVAGTMIIFVLPCLFRRRAMIFASIFAATFAGAVGVSRIYLGVHFPSDVAAGWLSGLVWLTALFATAHVQDLRRPYAGIKSIVHDWKTRALQIRQDIPALYFAYRDPRTPWLAKTLAIALVAYALSPIDLIPDFIPVLGLIDEVVLLPLGVALLMQLIPEHIMKECRHRAAKQSVLKSRSRIIAAAVIGVVWLVVLFWLAGVLFRLVLD
jgi:uncharacterized membrane protein YkvA (DUF1232 family)/membrane-associated phospholipid phosphatase